MKPAQPLNATKYSTDTAVLQWAQERNLLQGSNMRSQLMKTLEELGELALGINKGKKDVIKDSIGDALVTYTIARGCVSTGSTTRQQEYMTALFAIVCGMLAKEITPAQADELFVPLLRKMADEHGVLLEECYALAYNEIKDRKGKMVNGVFIKEDDLPHADTVEA